MGPLFMLAFVAFFAILTYVKRTSWRGVPSHATWLHSSPPHASSRGHMSVSLLDDGPGGSTGRSCFEADRHAAALVASHEARAARVGVAVGSTPTGNYVGLYWQYGRCHVIPAQALECQENASSSGDGTVAGHGFDDVGSFHVRGQYAVARVALTKQYVPYTGNSAENKGHRVELRLQLCDCHASSPERSADLRMYGCPEGAVGYFGSWHVRTSHYRGDAEMCLWLPPAPVPIGYVLNPHCPSGGLCPRAVGMPEVVPVGMPAVQEPAMPVALPVASPPHPLQAAVDPASSPPI